MGEGRRAASFYFSRAAIHPPYLPEGGMAVNGGSTKLEWAASVAVVRSQAKWLLKGWPTLGWKDICAMIVLMIPIFIFFQLKLQ